MKDVLFGLVASGRGNPQPGEQGLVRECVLAQMHSARLAPYHSVDTCGWSLCSVMELASTYVC